MYSSHYRESGKVVDEIGMERVVRMRSEDRQPSKRVFPLLQNLDLDTVTFAQIQSTGNPITIQDMNEQEMLDLIIVNLARLCTVSEWDGLLSAGASAVTVDPSQVTFATNYAAFQPLTGCPPYGTNSNTLSNDGDYYPTEWQTTTAQTGSNMRVAIYSSDDNGMPETLKGTATVPLDATGRITETLSAATEGLDVVKGSLYYVGWFGDNSGTASTIGAIPQLGYTSIAYGGGNNAMGNISSWIMTSATSTTAPTTFVTNETTYNGFPFIAGGY